MKHIENDLQFDAETLRDIENGSLYYVGPEDEDKKENDELIMDSLQTEDVDDDPSGLINTKFIDDDFIETKENSEPVPEIIV